mmetsp:Transcript_37864/g.82450  ORF Transcript_37864/g.82450 Transcript_37864/m.82450 type:complete len:115 (+) Transcript_37864:114-458(+)
MVYTSLRGLGAVADATAAALTPARHQGFSGPCGGGCPWLPGCMGGPCPCGGRTNCCPGGGPCIACMTTPPGPTMCIGICCMCGGIMCPGGIMWAPGGRKWPGVVPPAIGPPGIT